MLCVCACVRACVRVCVCACVRACVRVCVWTDRQRQRETETQTQTETKEGKILHWIATRPSAGVHVDDLQLTHDC